MGITWIPPSSVPSALNPTEAGVAGDWISILKPDSIDAEIITTHSDVPISCAVDFTVSPALPAGLSISATATGIKLSGDTKNALKFEAGIEKVDSVLVDATVNPVNKESYVVTVNATWTYQIPPAPPTSAKYTDVYTITVYNGWKSERDQTKSMTGQPT
jgi:hypothetical protein